MTSPGTRAWTMSTPCASRDRKVSGVITVSGGITIKGLLAPVVGGRVSVPEGMSDSGAVLSLAEAWAIWVESLSNSVREEW